jgi:hypothetical protein
MRDNQVEEDEQLDGDVLARRQGEHAGDKRTEMPVQAKDDLEWRSGEDNVRRTDTTKSKDS